MFYQITGGEVFRAKQGNMVGAWSRYGYELDLIDANSTEIETTQWRLQNGNKITFFRTVYKITTILPLTSSTYICLGFSSAIIFRTLSFKIMVLAMT